MHKRLICDYHGELQEFCIDDMDYFEGVEDEDTFLSSSERQTIVNNYLLSLRAIAGDTWSETVTFSDGQAISKQRIQLSTVLSSFGMYAYETVKRSRLCKLPLMLTMLMLYKSVLRSPKNDTKQTLMISQKKLFPLSHRQ